MVQEIIVFVLFFFIIGYGLYRLFFAKGSKSGGGCDKCASNKSHSAPEK